MNSINDDKQILNDIINNIKIILDKVFKSNEKKIIINRTHSLNFSCPYCEDSAITPRKRRGNLYLDSFYYHCFNCGSHKSYISFLKDFDIDINTLNKNDLNIIQNLIKNHTQSKKEFVYYFDVFLNHDYKKYLIDRKRFIEKLNLIDVKNHPILNYLNNRLQFEYNKFAFDDKHKRLYIFNLDPTGDYILGAQTKNFKFDTSEYIRFETFKLSRLYDLLDLNIYEDEGFEYLDDISTIFNILNVDLNDQITLFEGPMDSFLFKNSIALGGVNKSLNIELNNIRYLLDFDSIGIKKSIDLIKKNKRVFLYRKFLKDLISNGILKNFTIDVHKKLDWNDVCMKIVEQNLNRSEIKNLVLKNNLHFFNILNDFLIKFNINIDRYFSNSSFDVINI